MSPGQPNSVLRHLRRVAGLGASREATDAALLARYLGSHDEQAFAALVHRYGRLVRSVCRRVLRHLQDTDDAFQATFLVFAARASSIRKAASVSSWLYGVAYRTAMSAKRKRTQRREQQAALECCGREQPVAEAALRELEAILDQEVQALPEKYRAPFLLCCLDGRSKAEAARQLGWKEGTVSGRLARAREKLRQRLCRRGVGLTAVLCAVALDRAAAAAVPSALVKCTTSAALSFGAGKAVAADLVSAEVVALAKGAFRTMWSTKLKTATALLVALGCLTGAGLVTLQALAGGPEAPRAVPEDKREPAAAPAAAPRGNEGEAVAVTGRVLDPDGKPVAGARLHQGSTRRAVSDGDGRFRFTVPPANLPVQIVATANGFGLGWVEIATPRAAVDLTLKLVTDAPITGRVIDPEGRPVAGATVRPVLLAVTPAEDLSAWLQLVQNRKANSLFDGDHFRSIRIGDQRLAGLPQTVTTDRSGRFRLAGFGRERLVIATVGAPKYQIDMIGIITRPAAGFHVTDEWKLSQNVYGARFDHVLAPSRVITGRVRDQDTGKPIAGVVLVPEGAREYGSMDATTGPDGTYRIDSLPGYYGQHRAQNVGGPVLVALPPRNEPYFRALRPVGRDQPRDRPLVLDFSLKRGIWVTAKVTSKATGKPIAGAHVEYYPFRTNPHTTGLADAHFGWMPYLDRHRTGADGTVRVPALPGPGLFGAGVDDRTAFGRAEQLRYEEAATVFSPIFHSDMQNFLQGIVKINPPEGAKAATYEVFLDPGRTLTCVLTGPDGKPLTGCRLFNAVPNAFGSWSNEPLVGSEFTLRHLPLGKPYNLIALHPEKKLVCLLELRGDEKGPLSVKLESAGTITGRLLDPDGKPMPRTSVTIDFELKTGGGLLSYFPSHVKTDAEGRFRIEGLAPGTPYFILLGEAPKFLGEVTRLKLRPGESRELGDVKYTPLPQ